MHSKAVSSYENAESRVKLCREKGKQTNMLKLMDVGIYLHKNVTDVIKLFN